MTRLLYAMTLKKCSLSEFTRLHSPNTVATLTLRRSISFDSNAA